MEINLLLQTLNFIRPLSGKLQERLSETLKEESFPKKHVLLKQGETNRKIYYIIGGLARNYYLNEHGKECTTWFMQNGDFMISVYSFFTQQPSPDTIELLEDTTTLSISWTQLQSIYADFPEFNFHGRLITERYYMESERRMNLLRNGTALERYTLLNQERPEIIRRVPLKMIASYLNVSNEALCRIRAQQFH